jgi:hypothetical protein
VILRQSQAPNRTVSMYPRLFATFLVAALAIGTLATSLLWSGQSTMPQTAAPEPEMVPMQGWPWSFFGVDRSEPEVLREPRAGPEPREQGGEPKRRRGGMSGTYRTVCVRLCDGFHWPISHATTPDHFARDAKRCEQACPARSRLFVHQASDAEPAAMKDLHGQPYDKLENAFRHRREYVAGCTCHGNPWDAEALARHRGYAEAAKAAKTPAVANVGNARSDKSRRELRTTRSDRWARGGGWRDHAENRD